jgi:hypothetical protein
MPGLIIDTTINLEVQSFQELEPRQRGQVIPAFNNSLRSTVSDGKRNFQAVTEPLSASERDALRTAIANSIPVDVAGDCLEGDTVECIVTATWDLFGTDSTSFLFVATLSLRQT